MPNNLIPPVENQQAKREEMALTPSAAAGRTPPPIKRGKRPPRPNDTGKPVPQPGKYKPLLDFNCLRMEENVSRFDLDTHLCLDQFILHIAERSEDALVRMTAGTVNAQAISDSLRSIVPYYIAIKLMKTATPSQAALLGPYRSIERSLENCPIPAPLVEMINTLGNFSTETELWRLSGLVNHCLSLFSAPTAPKDQITINSDVDWISFSQRVDLSTLSEKAVLVNANEFRPPSDIDWLDLGSVTTFSNLCDQGANPGQQTEVLNRHQIAAALASVTMPRQAIRANLAQMIQLTLGLSIVFTPKTPSAIKQEVSIACEQYARKYRQPLQRVWTLATVGSLTESGSPAQLLKLDDNVYMAKGSCDVTPTDFLLASQVTTNPRVTSRPPSTWTMTQGLHQKTLESLISEPSIITQ